MAAENSSVVKSVCSKCGKNAVKSIIKCEKCANIYHISCAKLITNASDNNQSLICCDNDLIVYKDADAFCDALLNIDHEKKIDIVTFNYILKQKDQVISALQDQIKVLNDHINLLNSANHVPTYSEKLSTRTGEKNLFLSDKGKNNSPANAGNIYDKVDDPLIHKHKPAMHKVNKNTQKKSGSSSSEINNGGPSSKLTQEEMKTKLNTYIHINDDTGKNRCPNEGKQEDAWKHVQHKTNNRRRSIIVGNNINCAGVKGVPKYVYLHVYRLEKNTTTESLTNLLKSAFPEVTCEIMVAKYPDMYSSFKVGVFERNFKQAMDPSLWPYGTCIGRFLDLKRRVEQTVN